MKNTRKTVPFLLLSTMALGLIVAVTADRAPEADPLLEDEIVTTEDGGRAIAFGNHVKKANEVDTAHPVLGIDVTDVGENKAIRFVAAIDGYQGLSKATWTRSVKEADAVIKEEASFDLKYVYTELPRAADVQWTTPLEEGKTYYYMTYTLNNSTDGNYMWLCVPDTMTINRVTLNGFDVPMEAAQSASTSLGAYKCYRSSNALVAKSYTIVIS